MRRSHLIATAALVVGLLVPTVAVGAVGSPSAVPKSAGATTSPGAKAPTYNLDWAIGVAGKSGCLVCHGDRNLVRIVNGKVTSLYVDSAVLDASAHARTLCTDCHSDFAYKTPHPVTVAGDEWRIIAKSACKNCHTPQSGDYTDGAHSQASQPGDTSSTVGAPNSSAPGKPRPLCGDCHGGHAIPSKTDTAAAEAIHASALEMCGQCHVERASTYEDYYHGAAYRRGATDAPACWQCHNTHLILPAANRLSWVSPDNLITTCGQCHKGTLNDQYTSYAKLVHRKEAVLNENPVYAVAQSARQAISNALYQVGQVFRRDGS